MLRATVWQHSSYSNIKIARNSIEHFLWNPSDFSSDNVLSCLWIVFTNSVFQVPPQKIVRQVEILGIGWPGVIGLTRNESVPWEVMPEVFKCSVQGGGLKWSGVSFLEQNTWIPKLAWLFSEGVPERQSLWKQSTDKRGHHQKRNQTDSTRNAQ